MLKSDNQYTLKSDIKVTDLQFTTPEGLLQMDTAY